MSEPQGFKVGDKVVITKKCLIPELRGKEGTITKVYTLHPGGSFLEQMFDVFIKDDGSSNALHIRSIKHKE